MQVQQLQDDVERLQEKVQGLEREAKGKDFQMSKLSNQVEDEKKKVLNLTIEVKEGKKMAEAAHDALAKEQKASNMSYRLTTTVTDEKPKVPSILDVLPSSCFCKLLISVCCVLAAEKLYWWLTQAAI